DVRVEPHGCEAQGRRAAGGRGLHIASVRRPVRAWRDAGGGERQGDAQPPALRALLRARRRQLFGL
ncbi:MAG: Radical SAM domain protein, partial [uncultured Sphingomonas sp.]